MSSSGIGGIANAGGYWDNNCDWSTFATRNPRLYKAVTLATVGLSGGLSSSIAGGDFIDGFRQGVITAGLNHLASHVANGIEERNAFDKRFHKFNSRDRIPLEKRNIETVNAVVNDVDGLKAAQIKANSPKILVPGENNTHAAANTDPSGTEITLYHPAFESYYRLASVLFHEFWHAYQYTWNDGYLLKYAENRFGVRATRILDLESSSMKWLEMNAYKTQMNMGDMSVEGEFNKRYNSLFK